MRRGGKRKEEMKKKGRVIYMTLLPAPRDAVIPLSSYFFLSPNLSFLPFFPRELSPSLLASPSSIDKDRPYSPQSSLYHSLVSLGEEKKAPARYGTALSLLLSFSFSSRLDLCSLFAIDLISPQGTTLLQGLWKSLISR